MRNPSFAQDAGFLRFSRRKFLRWIAGTGLLLLVALSILYFRQHSMVYHPRRYDQSYADALPARGIEIDYTVAGAKYVAYYIPGKEKVPTRLWLAFCGNGSLALDWTTILSNYPYNTDAFLLIDYPGYGKNAGYATIVSTRASSDAALQALMKRLQTDEDHLMLCVIGHSLGSAVALDFAVHHHVQRIVLIAPFTTLREEAATMVGGWISHLLIESYDNRANLSQIAKLSPIPKIAIFHGTGDEVIPVRMGRELAHDFPFIQFFGVKGANHVSVLNHAHDEIIQWMNH